MAGVSLRPQAGDEVEQEHTRRGCQLAGPVERGGGQTGQSRGADLEAMSLLRRGYERVYSEKASEPLSEESMRELIEACRVGSCSAKQSNVLAP